MLQPSYSTTEYLHQGFQVNISQGYLQVSIFDAHSQELSYRTNIENFFFSQEEESYVTYRKIDETYPVKQIM